MREDEREPVLACLREELAEGRRDEGRELIDVEREGAPCGRRHLRPRVGRELELAHEAGPEERGGVLPDAPLGEVRDEDLPLVHEGAAGERAPGLCHDVPEKRRGQHRGDLVLHGRHDLGAEGRAVRGELARPVEAHEGVAHLAHDARAVPLLDEHA